MLAGVWDGLYYIKEVPFYFYFVECCCHRVRYMGSLCIISYNFILIYNYHQNFSVKILIILSNVQMSPPYTFSLMGITMDYT